MVLSREKQSYEFTVSSVIFENFTEGNIYFSFFLKKYLTFKNGTRNRLSGGGSPLFTKHLLFFKVYTMIITLWVHCCLDNW